MTHNEVLSFINELVEEKGIKNDKIGLFSPEGYKDILDIQEQ